MIQLAGVAVVQVALICMIAWCTCRCFLRNRSAESRHAIWLFALVSMGMVIPAGWLLPAIALPFPAGLDSVPAAVHSAAGEWTADDRNAVDRNAVEQGADDLHAVDWTAPDWGTEANGVGSPASDPWRRESARVVTGLNPSPTLDSTLRPAMDSAKPPRRFARLAPILAGIYAFGILAAMLRMLVAASRLRGMAVTATNLDADLQAMAHRCALKLSLKRSPRLLISADASTPLVFGILRSTILLPPTFTHWSTECQQSVLLHELAHVSRRDSIWDLVSQCVRACWWFHPFVHFSLLSLRREREAATDERVVASGIAAIEYAVHLLSVIEEIQGSRFRYGGIAMSRFGDTELRVKRILKMEAGVPKTSWPTCMAACGLFLAIGATSVRFATAQGPAPVVQTPSTPVEEVVPNPVEKTKPLEVPDQIEEQASVADQVSDENRLSETDEIGKLVPRREVADRDVRASTFYDALVSAPLASRLDSETLLSISGTVVASDGKPASGAVVVLRQSNGQKIDRSESALDLFARTTTDADGKFRFVQTPARFDTKPYRATWQVVAASQDQFGWQTIGSSKHAKSLRIALHDTASIHGTFVDPAGHPISGARVSVTSIEEPRPDDIWNPSLHSISLFQSEICPTAITDQDGRFELDGLPRHHLANLWMEHPEWADLYACVRTSESVELGPRFPDMQSNSINHQVLASGAVHRAQLGIPIAGTVSDSDGKPVVNCSVRVGSFADSVKTDDEGRFEYRLQPNWFDSLGEDVEGIDVWFRPPIDTQLLGDYATITQQQVSRGEPLNIVLEAGIEISGSVVTESGAPLEGVYVLAVPSKSITAPVSSGPVTAPSSDEIVRTPSASTDSEGTYRMVVPNDGDYRILAWGRRPGFALPVRAREGNGFCTWGPTTTVRATPGEVAKAAPIIVRKSPRVAFQCVDESGRPVSGATIQMLHRMPPEGRSWTRDVELTERETTDADGRAILTPTRLIASNVLVQAVVDEGDQHLWAEMPLPSNLTSQVHVVTMQRMWKITGKATVDGEPMPGVNVMVWRQPPDRSFMGSHSMSGAPKRVDEAGRYVWFVPPSGEYSVEVWSVKGLPRNNPSARRGVKRVGPYEFRAKEMRFQMAHGTISGRVIESGGEPIAGARVSSHPTFTDGNQLLLANPSPNTRHATSDADGRFQIEGLPDGDYQLSIGVDANPKTHYRTTATAKAGDQGLVIKMVTVKAQPAAFRSSVQESNAH